MKKIILILAVLVSCVFASDELNIDSLFKKQIGLRSITSFSLLSTGNANSYYIYPNIGVNGDLNVWNDTKQLYLNQILFIRLHLISIYLFQAVEIMQDKSITILFQVLLQAKIL
ncbi:hypothetical protein DA63_08770 [Campylobacter coli]|nr:hypothetical protein DA63_08770 [Campylobacter coli]